MSLCLQTNLSLDEMQELAVKHFSSVPNNKLPGIDFSPFNHENAFQSRFHENVFFVKPTDAKPYDGDMDITITWCVPSQSASKVKPYSFLRYIIYTIRGEGSLSRCLHTKGAYCFYTVINMNTLYTLFSFVITLTDEGLSNLDELIEAAFSFVRLYLPLIKGELLQQLYSNFVSFEGWQRILGFSPSISAERLAKKNLANYPLDTELEFDPIAIREAINTLIKGNFNITVTAPSTYDESIQFELKDERSGAEYTERRMPDKWISLWNNPKMFPELSLPSPNPYIASDFTVLYDGSQPVPEYPIKVYENEVGELWFRQDDKYIFPEACCYFYFKSPSALASVKNITMNSLLCSILQKRESVQGNNMMEAYIEFFFQEADDGIMLKVSGPNENLHVVLNDIAMKLKNFAENLTEDELRKNIHHELDAGACYAMKLRSSIVRAEHLLCHEQFRLAKSIQLSDMQEFCREYFRQIKIVALIQGNLSEDAAKSIMQSVETNLECGKIEDPKSIELHALKLPPGGNHLLVRPFEKAQCGSVAINYYQIGPNSHRAKALTELLLDICKNPLEEKEEFMVRHFSRELLEDCGILGYMIMGDSIEEKSSAANATKCIDDIHEGLGSLIEEMPAETFQRHIASVIEEKIPNDGQLVVEILRNWSEIVNGEYLFDRHQQEIEILRTISQSELLQFYREHSGSNERKLSIQCIGYTKETGLIDWDEIDDEKQNFPEKIIHVDCDTLDPCTVIKDIGEFKKNLEVYQQ